jgi:hypothetical protein
MKQYLLSIYQPDGPLPHRDTLEKVMEDMKTFIQETKTAGAWVFNGGLHPPSAATVIRVGGGEALMTDGPFAEGKEYIGGFVIVKARELDSALEWARKLARILTLPGSDTGLAVEVRPFQGEA